jgi:hypothetical protein
MRNDEGAWWAEVMNNTTLAGYGCTISHPMAEQSLASIFRGENVKDWLSHTYPWLHGAVVQA